MQAKHRDQEFAQLHQLVVCSMWPVPALPRTGWLGAPPWEVLPLSFSLDSPTPRLILAGKHLALIHCYPWGRAPGTSSEALPQGHATRAHKQWGECRKVNENSHCECYCIWQQAELQNSEVSASVYPQDASFSTVPFSYIKLKTH